MVKDGKLNNEAVAKWIYMHVPKHASDEAELEWEKCAKEATEPLSRDNNCKSYKKLKECEGIAFAKVSRKDPIFHSTWIDWDLFTDLQDPSWTTPRRVNFHSSPFTPKLLLEFSETYFEN